jgi:peptidoglycan/xylan/chitin deacetylase (PgdA/CDA1 family)
MNPILQSNLTRLRRFPILMFHRVVDQIPDGPLYDIHYTRENLERLMLFLRGKGFEAVTFEDLLSREAPLKPVMLTFDDGYEDNFTHLFPLLKKYGMKAVIYLLGDRTVPSNLWDASKGAPEARLMGKGQILEMARSGLVEFGGHSLTHARLTQLDPVEMKRQVVECKSSLEGLLEKPVLSFAYPYGQFNGEVKKAVAEAGYLFGIAVEWGPDHFGGDLMEIRRVCLSPDAGEGEFHWKTSFLYPAFRRWRKRLFSKAAVP